MGHSCSEEDRLTVSNGQDRAEFRSASGPGSDLLARARTSFLLDEAVEPGVVREPILASWTRSRQREVPADHLEMPFDADLDNDTLLTRAAGPILRDAADQFATEPVSVILCDANGVVLDQSTGDPGLEHHLERVWLAPGFSYAEWHVGTNGIGTALEAGRPTRVFGHEHYVEHLEDLACAGVPIRHPITRKVLGVIDLTCWRRDAGMMMMVTASTLARRIEEALLEQAGQREHALLHDYLTACRRSREAVLAISDDLLMMNDRARELLDPTDQTPLLAAAAEALASGRGQLMIDLPSGLTARVQCKPSFTETDVTGGVLQAQLLTPVPAGEARVVGLSHTPFLSTAIGSGALWTKCCESVDRYFQAREWLVMRGEPGTGKTTLARASHQSRTPAAHLRVLDAADHGPRWIADLIDELATGGGTLVLTHVDRLPPDAMQVLVDVLEPHRESTHPDRPWVVATVSHRERDADLTELLACFPRAIEVPPLRHHIEDVAKLVPHLLARLTRGETVRCSPEAMRVLMRHRWPGNVEQLSQVLRKATTRRRSGVIEVRDLPPECRAMTRRVLTRLEALECDAIVDALLDTDGNKAEAARLVGMSRASIYRKIRGYGISMPSSCKSG
jgi:sigma-54 dependent transcriptional regulator, acetoin dehydrogenase operon transcriptional activator AcoR